MKKNQSVLITVNNKIETLKLMTKYATMLRFMTLRKEGYDRRFRDKMKS